MKEKICVIGLGYIGLPTACMFAKAGHSVIGIDVNEEIVSSLNKGHVLIEEPNLEQLAKEAVAAGTLRAQTTPDYGDVFIIAVPTPIDKNKKADMKYVEMATKSIVPYLKKGNIVILESTSPPKTVSDLMLPILKEANLILGEELFVAHSPERVLPGKILTELVANDRIVGGINPQSSEKVSALYKSFVEGSIFLTDATTAEMCKLMENTFRDVNIALANEVAKICENMGINAWEVIRLANKHPRVNIHQPGPGVGGHCIAVDPWFIVEAEPDVSPMITLARNINDGMPQFVFDKGLAIMQGQRKKVSILGVTYKPNVDDKRESPVLKLIELFEKAGIDVSVYDPHVKECPCLERDFIKCVTGSDLIILAVNHTSFLNLDFAGAKKAMNSAHILDTRNFFDREQMERLGFEYYLLGLA